MSKRTYLTLPIAVLCIAGCAVTPPAPVIEAGQSQLALRSYQSRVFETADRERTLRAVVATLQDLSFVLDDADAVLGIVSATKLDGYQLKMTVSVQPRGESQVVVRANARINLQAIEDPEPYQDFFAALSKSEFLIAEQVN